jgi:hypothetical protein
MVRRLRRLLQPHSQQAKSAEQHTDKHYNASSSNAPVSLLCSRTTVLTRPSIPISVGMRPARSKATSNGRHIFAVRAMVHVYVRTYGRTPLLCIHCRGQVQQAQVKPYAAIHTSKLVAVEPKPRQPPEESDLGGDDTWSRVVRDHQHARAVGCRLCGLRLVCSCKTEPRRLALILRRLPCPRRGQRLRSMSILTSPHA